MLSRVTRVRHESTKLTARLHHHVSQCYLKGFANDRAKPRLFVIDLKERRGFSASPENVAAERDFHRIDIEGFAPDALENELSKFETSLDQALRRINETRSIVDPNDRAVLFKFIAVLAAKNPRLRGTFGDFRAQVAKRIMDLATATPDIWSAQIRAAKRDGFLPKDADEDYERMRAFVERGEYSVITPTMEHLRVEMGTIDKVVPHINRRRWILLRAPQDSLGFITSDHPVCLMWANPKRRNNVWPPGFALPNTQLVFPVSHRLAIIGAFEAEEEERDADEVLVAQINGSIFLHSTRQVYARDQNFPYLFAHSDEIKRGFELLNEDWLKSALKEGE